MSKNILNLFNGGDIEGITQLITRLEESSFDYLRLEGEGLKLVIGKNGVCETESSVVIPQPVVSVPAGAGSEPVAEAAPPAPEPVPAVSESAVPHDGAIIVKSPSYGIFYAQSEPGAPAYVSLGDTVKKGDTLGLLEIMKTFNAITSEYDGKIVAIHVTNQQLLEPETPLFSIEI